MKSVLKKATAAILAFLIAAGASGIGSGFTVSAADAASVNSYITTLNGYLNSLYVKMRKCKNLGIPTDYEQVTYSVLERWAKKYLKEDIENGYYKYFDLYTRPELERMYQTANENLQAYISGTKEAFSVPRYVSSTMETDGFTVTAQTKTADGEETRRPVFFTGYGHFADAAADIPKFQSFGANTIQNEIGTNLVIVDNMAWNVTCVKGADAAAKLSTEEKHSGEYSLVLSNKTPKESGVYLDVSQQVKLKPNTAYTLSLWVKAKNASGVQISQNGGVSRFLINGGSYDWEKYSFNFTTNSTAQSGQIWILVEDITEALFIDDIELLASNTAENSVENGGFEDYKPSADGNYYIYANGISSAEEMLKNAEENNIAVSLLLSPHYFPDFLLEKYPEICGENGKFIPTSGKALEILSAYIEAVIPRIKEYKSLNNICLTNEPSFCPAEYGDFYKPQWEEFLKEKYGQNLENLNNTYGSSYASWADIEMQETYSGDALGYDNRLFARRIFANWHSYMANTVHKIAPEIPVHAKLMGYIGTHRLFNEKLSTNADFEMFNEFSDLAGCDYAIEYSGITAGVHKPLSELLWYDYMAGVSGKPVINSEDHMYIDGEENFSQNQRKWMQTNIWQGAVHHRALSQIWTWRKDYNPKSIYYGSMLFRPDCIETIGKTNLDLNRLSYEVSALVNEPEEVAVLYSSASRQYNSKHMNSVYNAYEASLFCGKKVRVVSEGQLDAIGNCKVLILADCSAAPSTAAEMVYEFMKNGGKVICTGADAFANNESNLPQTNGIAAKIKAEAFYAENDNNLAKTLEKYYNEIGLEKVVLTDAETDEHVSDTEWTYAEFNGGLLVNICSYDLGGDKEIEIKVNGSAVQGAKELRSGEELGEVILLKPYEPILVYVSGEETEEVENIRIEPCSDGKINVLWNLNDKNAVGANVYGYSESGGLIRLAATNEQSCLIGAEKLSGLAAIVIKTYNAAGVESSGRAATYSEDKLFSVACTAENKGSSVAFSVCAEAKSAAAGTVVVILKDNSGRVMALASGSAFCQNGGKTEFDGEFGGIYENAAYVEAFVVGNLSAENKISNIASVKL